MNPPALHLQCILMHVRARGNSRAAQTLVNGYHVRVPLLGDLPDH
jgi:hypothetical protein